MVHGREPARKELQGHEAVLRGDLDLVERAWLDHLDEARGLSGRLGVAERGARLRPVEPRPEIAEKVLLGREQIPAHGEISIHAGAVESSHHPAANSALGSPPGSAKMASVL